MLIDAIATTKTSAVSILQTDFENFAKHYPFLVTNTKQHPTADDDIK